MKYTGLTYRPPFEANSLLLQVMRGCAHSDALNPLVGKLTCIAVMIIFIMSLASCSGQETIGEKPDPSKTQAQQEMSGDLPSPEVQRNEENDMVMAITVQEFTDAWNIACERNDRPDAVLPKLSEFNTYVSDTAIHSDHKTRHYVYSPGDEKFYPILDIYVSEKSGDLLEAELSYNEHDYRESTWKLHEEMCITALTILMQDLSLEDVAKLVDQVNEQAAEHMAPRGESYGRNAVPSILICHNGIGVYPYFEEGSRSHFCMIPIDDKVITEFRESGTEIRNIQ